MEWSWLTCIPCYNIVRDLPTTRDLFGFSLWFSYSLQKMMILRKCLLWCLFRQSSNQAWKCVISVIYIYIYHILFQIQLSPVHLTQLILRLNMFQNPEGTIPIWLMYMVVQAIKLNSKRKKYLKTSISLQSPNKDSKSPAELPECGTQVCIWLASHWHPHHNLHIKERQLELSNGVLT